MARWRDSVRRGCGVAAIVLAVTAVPGPPTSAASSTQSRWRLANGDLRNSSFNPGDDVPAAAKVHRLRRQWSRKLIRNTNATPLIAGGRVFTHCDFDFCAFRLSSGRRAWRVKAETSSPRPAIAKGVVFLQRRTHPMRIVALRAKTGERIWSKRFPGVAHLGGWITVRKGHVLLSGTDGNMYALDRTTGAVRWRTRIGAGSIPAVSQGLLLTNASDGGASRLTAFRAADGKRAWTASHFSTAVGAPVVMGGRVYIRTSEGQVLAWNVEGCGAEFCPPAWTAPARVGQGGSHPAAWRNRLYFQLHDGRVDVINATTGRRLWRTTQGAPSNNTPTIARGVLYVADGRTTRAFAAAGCGQATCSPLWRRSLPEADGLSSRPVVAARSLVVLGGRGVLLHRYAIPTR